MNAKKIAPFLLILFVPLFAIVFRKAYMQNAQQGVADIGQEEDYPYSRYSRGNGKVYYLKAGSGYFPVDVADVASFSALNFVNDRGTLGKDAKHVFYKTRIVAGVDPASVNYLGNNFFKAGLQAFYGDSVLKISDTASFHFIKGYYAADRMSLFYKQHPIPGADVHSLRSKDLPSEYVSDHNKVYYNGEVIKGARPDQFVLLSVADDQWHTQYAFDGEHYFFGKYEIRGQGDENQHKLQLLTLDKGFSWHGIFYQGKAIYCYDTDRNKLVKMGDRENASAFTMIDRGIFTDGRHIYFTFTNWNKSGGRMPHYTGHTTGICAINSADPHDFKAAGKYVTSDHKMEGILYKSAGRTYFHPTSEVIGNYSAGLMLLNADGTTKKLSTWNAFSKSISNDDGPSIFNLKFYKNLLKAEPVYDDY